MAEHAIVKRIGKATLVYFLVFGIVLGAISLLLWSNLLQADAYYYFAQVLALTIGIVHVFLMYRLLPFPHPDQFGYGLAYTLICLALGMIAATVIYYLLNLDFRFLTYLFPFLVPYLIWQCFRFFAAIPPAAYKPWYYPLDAEMPDLDMIDLSQIEVVQFVFSKNASDPAQTNFTSKAPLNMTLGQLFFIFINDYNDKNPLQPIEFLNAHRSAFGWHFYREKKWFKNKHYFDPDLSFRENGIQPNEFIYSTRLKS